MISLLLSVPEFEVVGEARTGEEAVMRAAQLQPDVVLMDLQMPEVNGIEATRRILQESPSIRVLVVTIFEDDDSVSMALRAGGAGTFSRTPTRRRWCARSAHQTVVRAGRVRRVRSGAHPAGGGGPAAHPGAGDRAVAEPQRASSEGRPAAQGARQGPRLTRTVRSRGLLSRGLPRLEKWCHLSRFGASSRRRRWSCGIIRSTMWKRLLAGIFGLVGLVMWKRCLGKVKRLKVEDG